MKAGEPTKEQIDIISANKKLNEWCGTEGINYYEGDTALGFLFRYAVPKLEYYFEVRLNETLWKNDGKRWRCRLFNKGFRDRFESYGATPALALSQSIYKALGGKE